VLEKCFQWCFEVDTGNQHPLFETCDLKDQTHFRALSEKV